MTSRYSKPSTKRSAAVFVLPLRGSSFCISVFWVVRACAEWGSRKGKCAGAAAVLAGQRTIRVDCSNDDLHLRPDAGASECRCGFTDAAAAHGRRPLSSNRRAQAGSQGSVPISAGTETSTSSRSSEGRSPGVASCRESSRCRRRPTVLCSLPNDGCRHSAPIGASSYPAEGVPSFHRRAKARRKRMAEFETGSLKEWQPHTARTEK